MNKYFFVKLLLLTIVYNLFSVPPVPEKNQAFSPYPVYPSELFGPTDATHRNMNLPDSILVLRVEFSDVTFDLSGEQPTHFVPHDKDYFERWMYHLSSYYYDVSHGNYHLTEENYTVWDEVYSLPLPMGYYGDSNNRTKRIAEFARDVFEMADEDIDFSQYDSFIIFHAGAGQEADLSGNNQDALWSTFITRKTLQAGLDPENEDFPGIQTSNKIIREVVVVPESQWHPDSVVGETSVYGIFGVLAHLFGHQLGLPTLYDNNPSLGISYGVGNFCIMGTGLWNANGFVPPFLSAWPRYYLGWEQDNLVRLSTNADNQQISYPMANNDLPKIYQVKITDKEYFLLENRQYNPDNSTLNGFPNFTFTLLPPGQQDYYPPPFENIPRFNIMKNTYRGCEWDFFLPGPGYSDPPGEDNVTVDGSGLFIWHVDEHIIEQKFTPDFQYNSINGNPAHKGVDLEEADGIQHMDAPIDQNSLGSPYDSYRYGNNDYFGKMYYPGTTDIWLPTAESYYGGIPLEIKNISSSANTMSFSVSYNWQLQAPDYEWDNPYPAMILDTDGDGEKEIIYPMPNGRIFIWKNEEIVDDTIQKLQQLQPLSHIYSYDEKNNAFYFPTHVGLDKTATFGIIDKAFQQQLHNRINDEEYNPIIFENRKWAAPIVINPDHDSQAFLPLNAQDEDTAEVRIFEHFQEVEIVDLPNPIAGNMMYDDSHLFVVTKGDTYTVSKISANHFSIENTYILRELSAEKKINQAVLADWNQDGSPNFIFTVNDSLVYAYHANGIVMEGFPLSTGLYKSAIPSLADINGNGFLDVLIGGENTFAAVNHLGEVSKPSQTVPASDSLHVASGVIAVDLDNDGIPEIIGNMSKNRFCVWKNVNNNEYHLSSQHLHSYLQRSRNYPQLVQEGDELIAYVSADNGLVFRRLLAHNVALSGWLTEYALPSRVASYQFPAPQNQFASEKLFIDENTYVYPNPYSSIYQGSIFQGEVRSSSVTVKFMLSEDAIAEIKIFDIAGNKIFEEKKENYAYVQNNVEVNVENYSSGMYFALINAKEQTKVLKFAIEK